jgi:putative restriction endonuclease
LALSARRRKKSAAVSTALIFCATATEIHWGRQAYFVTARVTTLQQDPTLPDHYYAFVEDFLQFPSAVPFREGTLYYEAALRRSGGATSKGAFGRAVRPISDSEYDLILAVASSKLLAPSRTELPAVALGFADEQAVFEHPIVERITNCPFRDAAFSSAVRAAYNNTCALTGLKIINGGGRAEVQPAHIRPVANSGPDSVRNGLALCGTIHWMFDRGLLSLDDDLTILMAANRVPDTIQRLINPERRLLPSERPEVGPHASFLRYHRETVLQGVDRSSASASECAPAVTSPTSASHTPPRDAPPSANAG